jgi:tetratricopeptide (TPR) repeat protein
MRDAATFRPRVFVLKEAAVPALRRFSLVVALVLLAAQNVDGAPPSKEQIAKLVKQLGDNEFDVREAASRKLWEVGEVAEEALKEAAKSEDAEVSRRATEILAKFKWGLYPDTPKKVVELIESYQSADAGGKAKIIGDLFDAGAPGCKALLKIAKVEPDADVRANLMVQIAAGLPRAVPLLLEDDNPVLLERLVEIGLDNQVRTGIAHYAAYWQLSGRIDGRIAHFKALEKKSDDRKREAEILAYLYRAKGDLASAVEAARRAEVDDLIDHLLGEAADWKQLAERKASGDPGDELERLGHRAAYYRLAGQKKELNETLAEIKKLAEAQPADDVKRLQAAKALFLNGRTADALEVLGKGENAVMLFEILCARNQFKDAFDLVDKARFADTKEVPPLEIVQARTLYLLGEKDKSLPIFAKYAGMIKEGTDVSWFEDLIEAEFRCGLTVEAFEHATKVLTVSKDHGWGPRLFKTLYPSKKQVASDLWSGLRILSPKDEPAAAMKRLRALLDGKMSAKDVTEFLDQFADKPMTLPDAESPDAGSLVLAEVALAAKLNDRAVAILEKAKGSEASVRLGDIFADKKDWDKAAKAYRKAREADRGNPLPLWLTGWALKHGGKEAEGKKVMDQAHWLPMGDEAVRHQFALDLLRRNQPEASRKESELIVRVGIPGSFYTGEATRRLAIGALMRRDFNEAVEGHEKAMLRVLLSYVNFVQKPAYVLVPGAVHKMRAAALLKAGKTQEAMDEARRCLDIIPGNVDLPVLLVPELEKRGMKKEADDLFGEVLQLQEKLCRDYPNSAHAHNAIAWLRVCCGRDLDQALEHALKATKLAPKHAGHLDTLAEVYFQRGDKAKALETQRKVVELEPKRAYFRKQLKRIEAGDPKVERPMEEDDEDSDD